MPKITKKSARITARINEEAKQKLERICEKEHRSQGDQIEYWIAQYKFDDEK